MDFNILSATQDTKQTPSYIDTHLMLLGSKTIPKLDLKTGFKVKFNVGNPATSQKG